MNCRTTVQKRRNTHNVTTALLSSPIVRQRDRAQTVVFQAITALEAAAAVNTVINVYTYR